MKECLHITIEAPSAQSAIKTIKDQAKKNNIEGLAHLKGTRNIDMCVLGCPANLDQFVDILYVDLAKKRLKDISIEVCFDDHQFRGIFRVIE